MAAKVPRFDGFRPTSKQASRALAGSSSKDTTCERLLRSELWRMGLRFRKNVRDLPGKPDVVFTGPRVAVFVDGDFWHGRNWRKRKRKLQAGSNAAYWVPKIEANRVRDRRHAKELRARGWAVLRVWEADVLSDPRRQAQRIADVVRARHD